MVHADHADHVLTGGGVGTELLEVELKPWDWQDRLVKRVFAVVFAATGLVVLSLVILVIGVAIKLDDGANPLRAGPNGRLRGYERGAQVPKYGPRCGSGDGGKAERGR